MVTLYKGDMALVMMLFSIDINFEKKSPISRRIMQQPTKE
jgi:hypothetical protein